MNNRIFDLERLDHDVMVPQFTDHNDSLDPPGCYEIPFGEPGRIPQRKIVHLNRHRREKP